MDTIARATLAILAAIAAAPAAHAQRTGVNLVPNPGFERIVPEVAAPRHDMWFARDWALRDDGSDPYAYLYTSGYSGDPRPGAGQYFFAGGYDTQEGDVVARTRLIDLRGGQVGDLIRAGRARYRFGASYTSYRTQTDACRVEAVIYSIHLLEIERVSVGGESAVRGLPVEGGQRTWGRTTLGGRLEDFTGYVGIEIIADGAAINHDGYVDDVWFSVDPYEPGGFSILARADGAFADGAIDLRWENAPAADAYEVTIADNEAMEDPALEFETDDPEATVGPGAGHPLAPGTWYARVVATNDEGSTTADNGPVSFAILNPCPADFDGDGSLTIFDFLAFQNAFDAGCP